ncbi:MAG: efflux RND transporter permease subunit [Patescibacteria group bacterium]
MIKFWNFFVERRQFTILVMVALMAAGTAAVIAIPKENAPEVEVPVAVIATTLRGASAADTAALVTKEIEKQVGTIDNINKLTSSSREGISIVTAEFNASANLDKSIQDVKDAVDRAKPRLPRDADEPVVTRVSFSDQPILIISLSGGLPATEFAALAEVVKDDLERIPGVSAVNIAGTQDRGVTVVAKREALDAFGLTLSDIVGALAASNASLPVGTITVSDIEYAVAFKGDLNDPEDLRGVTVGSSGGSPIYLSDVAEIVNGVERAATLSRASVGGQPAESAVTLSVHKRSGANIFTTSSTVKERLTELQGTTLSGITTQISIDLGEEVEKSLGELVTVGIETVILVMLCLVITIGWRESVVAGLSIPLSFVIAFIGLYISGNTINFVSLFALILAIGILVDSGIVVTEAIHTRLKKFGQPLVAAKEAIREYAWPLTAGTLTTIAVFAPLFFISGITGEFIASIPFTVIFVLVASIFVALGLVPLIAIMFTTHETNNFEKLQEEWNVRAQEWYRRWLLGKLNNKLWQKKFLRYMAVAFIIALILPFTGLVKVIFFPGEDTEYAYLEIETKQGTPLYETDLAARAVEELLYGDPRIESFVTTVGGSSALSGASTGGGKLANITLRLVPPEDRDDTSTEIVEELRNKVAVFTTFTVRALEPQGGPPTGAPIAITFSGENLDDLERSVDRAERVLKGIEGTTEITTSLKDNGTEFALTIDRAKAAEVGLTSAQVASTLRTAVSGTVATTIKSDDEDIDVLVLSNLNPDWQDPSETAHVSIDALLNLPLRTPLGTVLLGSVVSPSVQKSNALITREDQKNIASISSYLTADKTATEVSAAFAAEMEKAPLPEGVAMKVGGETEDVDQSFQEMGLSLIGGMVLMLAILVLAFNSFRYSFYLLMLVPLSLVGVFAGLAITQQPLSFPSMLGVIALAGVIINHAIILVDSMIVRMKNPEGRALDEVVADAAVSRLRPIFLTTITTVVGMIPLAGASSLWGPLAFAIMFGLAFAMLLTLVLTPILIYRHPGKEFWKEEVH